MRIKISARERRWLILGGLAVAAYLAAVYVVEPFLTSQAQVREQIQERTALLQRYQLLASDKGRYQRRLEELKVRFAQAEALHFKGEKLPLVAAQIQGVLHQIGQEAGLTFVRENVAPPKKIEMFTQVTVELSLRGELKAIRDFLYKVQAAPQLLTIPRLTLRGTAARGQTSLMADLQVAGYMVSREEKTPAASPPAREAGMRPVQSKGQG